MFTKIHIKQSLRFRRWSRKQYAAFHSIGQHVTIGNLKGIIADTFLGKQKTLGATHSNTSTLFIANEYSQTAERPPTGQQHILTVLLPVLPQPTQYKRKDNFFPYSLHNG